MRAKLLFLVLSLSFTGAIALQDNEPSEKVFKNITALKGVPSRDLMPAMEFMSASLKVDCVFCHNPNDYAEDSKEEKETARKMIAMQKELNEKYFEGKLEVTCFSCHGGLTHPLSMPNFLIKSTRPTERGGAKVDPVAVLSKYRAQAGEIKSLVLTGTSTDKDAKKTAVSLTQVAPNKFFLETETQKMGSTGSATWGQTGPSIYEVWGDTKSQFDRFGRSFRGEHAFDFYKEISFSGRDKINGKAVIVLRGTLPEEKRFENLYFDEKSGLLLRVASFVQSPLGFFPELVDYSNYKKVAGIMVPMKVRVATTGFEMNMEFKSAKANVPVADSIFSKPGG